MNSAAYTRKSTVSKNDLLLLIQKSFTVLGCEAEDINYSLLDEIWCMENIWNSDVIAYYGTRLRLLEFLMARRFKAIDKKEGKGNGASTSKSKAHSDRQTGSLGTEFSDHYDEEQGVSRSDEITKSKTTDSGISEGSHCQTDVHRMLARDKGFGRSGSVTKGTRQGAHVTKSKTANSHDGQQTGYSNRTSCTWTFSDEKGSGNGQQTNQSFGGLGAGAGSTASSNASSAITYWSRGLYDSSKSSETNLRQAEGSRTINGDNRSFNQSENESGNFFTANNQTHQQKAHGGGSKDSSSHVKRSWTYGYGSGESYSKQDSWTDSGTKLNAYTKVRANSEVVSDAFDKFHFYSYKNQQLFNNLKIAYEASKANYDWLVKHLVSDVGTAAILGNLRDCAINSRFEDINFANLSKLDTLQCSNIGGQNAIFHGTQSYGKCRISGHSNCTGCLA